MPGDGMTGGITGSRIADRVRACGPTSGRSRRAARAVAVVIAVALAVLALVVVLADRRGVEREHLASEAVVAAETASLAMLDYQPDTVAEDLAAAEQLLTQPFLDTFREQSREVTIPRATAGKVTSRARSAGSALTALDGDQALVVVYLDRHIVDADAIPRVLQTVVDVTLVRNGDRWLVSAFTPR